MQRWRIEIEACADEMEFPDDTAQDVIDYALKERAHEMCEYQSAGGYWISAG